MLQPEAPQPLLDLQAAWQDSQCVAVLCCALPGNLQVSREASKRRAPAPYFGVLTIGLAHPLGDANTPSDRWAGTIKDTGQVCVWSRRSTYDQFAPRGTVHVVGWMF